jgi:SulP family sulfate permease
MNAPVSRRLVRRASSPYARDFGTAALIPAAVVGLTAGVIAVIRAISYSAIIFSGDLESLSAVGIGLALFSALVLGIWMALASTFPGTVAGAQAEPAVVLALIVTSVIGAGGIATAEGAVAAILAIVAVSSLLTGLCFLLLGAFRLGNLIRFIPYPVIGGFLAGIGWLLISGSFTTMTLKPLTLENLPYLAQGEMIAKWLPGVAFAFVLWGLQRRLRHYLTMPSVVFGAIALFYLGAWLGGASIADLRAGGFLLGPFPAGGLWQPLTPALFAEVDWLAILAEIPAFGSVLIISVISFLLIASSLEVVTRRDIDLNHELRATGIANIVAGLGAGLPGYHSLSLSVLTHRMGAPVRLSGLLAAALCGAVLFLGGDVLSFLPKMIVGGLLFYVGLDFLLEWAVEAWFRLARGDYLLVLLVLATTAGVGFLEGIGVGIVAGLILFTVSYSRVNVVKHALSGVEFHSNVDRSEALRARLKEQGEAIYVLKLQGYIFFGTANRLLNQVRSRAGERDRPPLRYAVLDFRRVNGLDSSAVLSLTRMVQHAQDHDFVVVFTGLTPVMENLLQRESIDPAKNRRVRIFADLDHGLEWCENELLDLAETRADEYRDPVPEQLRRVNPMAGDLASFMSYTEPVSLKAGDYLLRQGEVSDDLYFIETGKVTAQLETSDGKTLRLRTMGPGTIVGEVAFYLGVPRSASVVADAPATGYRLTKAGLTAMKRERPEIAAVFHEFIAQRLAERVADTNKLLDAIFD